MNFKFLTIIGGFAMVCVLMIIQATRQGAAPVLLPSEVLAKGTGAELPRLRVAGRVAAKDLDYRTSPEIKLSFRIEDPKHPEHGSLPVVYRGIRPDMFAPGRDVIIDGSFHAGVIAASGLLTQCPSKYEPPDPDKRYHSSQGATQ